MTTRYKVMSWAANGSRMDQRRDSYIGAMHCVLELAREEGGRPFTRCIMVTRNRVLIARYDWDHDLDCWSTPR